jgi:signal transduction histidine kinase
MSFVAIPNRRAAKAFRTRAERRRQQSQDENYSGRHDVRALTGRPLAQRHPPQQQRERSVNVQINSSEFSDFPRPLHISPSITDDSTCRVAPQTVKRWSALSPPAFGADQVRLNHGVSALLRPYAITTDTQLDTVSKELQQSFERMKRSERLSAIGQLSAGLAHEIRNPLASIGGAAAILGKNSESAERRMEFLEIIEKECLRLNRLLTNFLEFARPRLPQYQLADVGPILESVIGLAAHSVGRQPIQFAD